MGGVVTLIYQTLYYYLMTVFALVQLDAVAVRLNQLQTAQKYITKNLRIIKDYP